MFRRVHPRDEPPAMDNNNNNNNNIAWDPYRPRPSAGFFESTSVRNPRRSSSSNKALVPGQTALHLAVVAQQTEIVALLLRHGSCLTTTDALGQSPLHLVCASRNHGLVDLLLQHVVNNNKLLQRAWSTANVHGRTIWHEAAWHGNGYMLQKLLRLLEEQPPELYQWTLRHVLHTTDPHGRTLLHLWMQGPWEQTSSSTTTPTTANDSSCLWSWGDALVRHLPSDWWKRTDKDGNTLLHAWAHHHPHDSEGAWLLQHAASSLLSHRNDDGLTPLELAASCHNSMAVFVLLRPTLFGS